MPAVSEKDANVQPIRRAIFAQVVLVFRKSRLFFRNFTDSESIANAAYKLNAVRFNFWIGSDAWKADYLHASLDRYG